MRRRVVALVLLATAAGSGADMDTHVELSSSFSLGHRSEATLASAGVRQARAPQRKRLGRGDLAQPRGTSGDDVTKEGLLLLQRLEVPTRARQRTCFSPTRRCSKTPTSRKALETLDGVLSVIEGYEMAMGHAFASAAAGCDAQDAAETQAGLRAIAQGLKDLLGLVKGEMLLVTAGLQENSVSIQLPDRPYDTAAECRRSGQAPEQAFWVPPPLPPLPKRPPPYRPFSWNLQLPASMKPPPSQEGRCAKANGGAGPGVKNVLQNLLATCLATMQHLLQDMYARPRSSVTDSDIARLRRAMLQLSMLRLEMKGLEQVAERRGAQAETAETVRCALQLRGVLSHVGSGHFTTHAYIVYHGVSYPNGNAVPRTLISMFVSVF